MKTLQNNFTTLEQSKRLLELGLPIDSADCYYTNCIPHCNRENYNSLNILPYDTIAELSSMKDIAYKEGGFLIPCWSVGRLMEIAHICSNSTLSYKEEVNEIQKFKEDHKCETLIEAIIDCIADAVSIGNINFSKLGD